LNKLRTWRLERGLAQVELADAAGVKRWCIHMAENGIRCPSQDEQAALSEALGVPQETLFPTIKPKAAK
jgi:DNA-binding XRE family transcriptional regulator